MRVESAIYHGGMAHPIVGAGSTAVGVHVDQDRTAVQSVDGPALCHSDQKEVA